MKRKYKPKNVSPPGHTLSDMLSQLKMRQADLAQAMNRPRKTINEIIKGKAAITPETAIQLEKALGVSAEFWMARETTYRLFLARQL